jgi:hypothetical protein
MVQIQIIEAHLQHHLLTPLKHQLLVHHLAHHSMLLMAHQSQWDYHSILQIQLQSKAMLQPHFHRPIYHERHLLHPRLHREVLLRTERFPA